MVPTEGVGAVVVARAMSQVATKSHRMVNLWNSSCESSKPTMGAAVVVVLEEDEAIVEVVIAEVLAELVGVALAAEFVVVVAVVSFTSRVVTKSHDTVSWSNSSCESSKPFMGAAVVVVTVALAPEDEDDVVGILMIMCWC